MSIWEQSTPGRGNSSCQDPEADVCLASCPGHSGPQNVATSVLVSARVRIWKGSVSVKFVSTIASRKALGWQKSLFGFSVRYDGKTRTNFLVSPISCGHLHSIRGVFIRVSEFRLNTTTGPCTSDLLWLSELPGGWHLCLSSVLLVVPAGLFWTHSPMPSCHVAWSLPGCGVYARYICSRYYCL